jgi:SpoVK/Ycf46/Vps4 family AAA+-type ATPase
MSSKEFDAQWAELTSKVTSKEERKTYQELVNWDPSKIKDIKEKKEKLVDIADKVAGRIKNKNDLSEELLALFIFVKAQQKPAGGSSIGGWFQKQSTSTSGEPSNPFNCPTPLSDIKMTFDDIAGIPEVKRQMEVGYIMPFVYSGLFPTTSKGTLLYGPPGTGKTSIAKASTAQIPGSIFYAPSPADIKGKFLGETEKNIRSVFECADQGAKTPGIKVSIIFIDEFEAIGGFREKSEGMGASVNALLQEMDGIKARPKVSVLAATNYPWCLDAAIRRRFTSTILVGLPDEKAIEFLVRHSLAKMYTPPGEGFRDQDGDVEIQEFYDKETEQFTLDANYMDAIKEYGGFIGKSQRAISIFSYGSNTESDRYIDDDFIEQVVKKLGPTDTGKKIKKEWYDEGKSLTFEDPRLQENSIFGYSPSDISKVMKYAINESSLQALGYGYKEIDFADTTYYVSNYKDTNRKIGELTRNQNIAITFDIRKSHILNAMKNVKSTVTSMDYFRMMYYERYGNLPEDQIELTCG